MLSATHRILLTKLIVGHSDNNKMHRINKLLEKYQIIETKKFTRQGVTIGDKFKERSKNNSIAIVTDIHTVTDSKGKKVRFIIIATKDFLGQKLTFEVPAATVVRRRV